MKKMKKLLSAMTAVSVLSSMVICSSANAICESMTYDELDEAIENGYVEIDFNDSLISSYSKEYEYVFLNNNAMYKGFGQMMIADVAPNYISIDFSPDTDFEFVENTISKICPNAVSKRGNLELASGTVGWSVYSYDGINPSYEESRELNITDYQAKQLYDALNEKGYVQSYLYHKDYMRIARPTTPYITAYMSKEYALGKLQKYDNDEEMRSAVENYIKENDLNCHIGNFSEIAPYPTLLGKDFNEEDYIKNYGNDSLNRLKEDYNEVLEANDEGYAFCVIPDYELTAKEHLALAKQISRDVGISPIFMTPTSSSEASETVIEMHDYVPGDANESGDLDMSDAVFIMQCCSNPDKYQMTAQGRYNADFNNDGITNEDALTVQKILLEIE